MRSYTAGNLCLSVLHCIMKLFCHETESFDSSDSRLFIPDPVIG